MKLTHYIKLTCYYLKNSYKKIKNIILMITFSLIMIFTILFSSTTIQNTIDKKVNHEILFYATYSNGVSFDDSSLLLNDIQIDILNHKYSKIGNIQRIQNENTISVYFTNEQIRFDWSFSQLSKKSLYFDSDLPILSINEYLLEAQDINIGDAVRIHNTDYTVVKTHESIESNSDLLFPKYIYQSFNSQFISNDLKIELYDKELYHIHSEEILLDVNDIVESNHVYYQKTSIGLTTIISSIIDLISRFLMAIAFLIFFICVFSISNIVQFSALERKEEFIVLKTFGLSNYEILKLLVIEVIVLMFFSLVISLLFSFCLVWGSSFLLGASFLIDYYFIIISVVLFVFGVLAGMLSSKKITMYDINDI